MKRKALKTIENKIREFIPKNYKDLKEDAEDIYDRPLIFGGKFLTRDQRFEFQGILKVNYPKGVDLSKMTPEQLVAVARSEGHGEAYKFIWDNCIHYIKNVIIRPENASEDQTYDKVESGEIKDLLWEQARDFDGDVIQAASYFVGSSSFTEEESKNSDSLQDSTVA